MNSDQNGVNRRQWRFDKTIGPRQRKRVIDALASLNRAAHLKRRSDGTVYCATWGDTTTRGEEEIEAIGDRFSWTASKANHKAIIQAIEESIAWLRRNAPMVQGAKP